MIRKFSYTDILGWSHSRYNTFTTCKRQYYYSYYRKYDPETALRANVLHRLTSVPLEIGTITHELIESILRRMKKSVDEIDRGRFTEFAIRKSREVVEGKQFQEVYYGEKAEIDFDREIFSFVSKAMVNFLESDFLDWIKAEALAEAETWVIEPDGYGECRIDDMKAYCKVDFMFPIDGKYFVYDWKTGKRSPKHKEQLWGYAAWVHFHFGASFEEIRPAVVYLLPEYKVEEISLSEFEIDELSDRIRRETEEMYSYLSEVEKNKPKPKSEFPMTENLKLCGYCNFRELCGRE
ncbi:MAG: PD-(D/E)XK nuclease family protein [Pyrinomonadaceae bacterium]